MSGPCVAPLLGVDCTSEATNHVAVLVPTGEKVAFGGRVAREQDGFLCDEHVGLIAVKVGP